MGKKLFSADRLLAPGGQWIENHVIITDDRGKIEEIIPMEKCPSAAIQQVEGAIIPGFVNAHCHLELSHMQGMIPTGTGLVPFIKTVVSQRAARAERIQAAVVQAEQRMREAGIVAVGDISNVTDSFAVKQKSPIQFYTFIEVFDFMQSALTDDAFQKAQGILAQLPLKSGDGATLVPHAPYSVSPTLFARLAESADKTARFSIHNQELEDEDRMFQEGQSRLITFFELAGFDMSHFEPTGTSSLRYALAHMPSSIPTLMVHNTQTTKPDIAFAERAWEQLYWVSCPNANLYIENQLPDYDAFMDEEACIALGTDSLASNWQLSILDEIKTLRKYKSYLPSLQLLQWGTENGAKALGFEDRLGTLEKGKRPGLNHLNLSAKDDWEITSSTDVRRII
jgi:cytosine/adenosine deaminase-related metal-dependent hydrolase